MEGIALVFSPVCIDNAHVESLGVGYLGQGRGSNPTLPQ